MFQTLAVVQAGGARRRQLSHTVGGVPVLEWVLRRLSEAQQLDHLVVLTGHLAEDESILGLVPPDVCVFRSSRTDFLGRLHSLLQRYPAQALVLVPADTPFVDPVLIDRLVTEAREHPQCDYLCYATADGKALNPEQVGLFGEWVRAEVIHELHRRLVAAADRQHPLRYLLHHSGAYSLRLLALPEPLSPEEIRLRVESVQDWEHLETIYEALGPERLDWKHIFRLLNDQPQLRRQMALLNQRAAGQGS